MTRELPIAITRHRRLISFLRDTKAVVLLDGLDEVRTELHLSVVRDIRQLARHLEGNKIILTCRSGQGAHFEGFDVVEICPLEPAQIRQVATKWLKQGSNLLEPACGFTIS